MSKWIRFSEPHSSKSGKTFVWTVIAIDGSVSLGEIRWLGRWRKYAFFPKNDTVFEKTCLRDIADFCEIALNSHKRIVWPKTPTIGEKP